MPPLTLLIKPASSLCNMRCRYCFYCDEASNRAVGSYGIMSEETTEIIIKRAMEEASFSVTFAFQGGEPTLAGIGYFRLFCELAKKYNKNDLQIHYSIQTNGILFDNEWAVFLRDNNFLVGLSFDGTREYHASRVLKCAALLDRYKVDYNILTVMTPVTARHIAKIYTFYKKQGWRYMQFIPCLSPLHDQESKNYALSPDQWLEYNKKLFDLWYTDNKIALTAGSLPAVSVRHLDDYLRLVAGQQPESCGTLGFCTVQNVIEADGSVYPCDFWALDEYKLGNIRENIYTFIMLTCGEMPFMQMVSNMQGRLRAHETRQYIYLL
jgi:uncharacterized protein